MNKVTKLRLVIAGLLLVILTLVGFSYSAIFQAGAEMDGEKPVEETISEQMEVIEQIKKTKSKYPGLHLETQTVDSEKYIYAIHSLKTDSPNLTNTIQTWIETNKKKFVTEANNYAVKGHTASLHIDLETIPLSDTVYNVIFTKYEIVGGANGSTEIYPLTINIEEDRIYSLTDFIEETESNKEDLTQIILDHLSKNEALKTEIIEEELIKSLMNFDDLKWSITDEALTLYWDEYEIAVGSAGPIQLSIPLKEIEHLVIEKAHALLQIEYVTGNNDIDLVKKPNVEPLDPNGKYVALTFDDGPHEQVTEQVLYTLKQYNAKATFFMLGNQVDFYPSLVQRVAEEGHEIGNHSETHPDLTKLSSDRIQKELSFTNNRIKEIIGRYPTMIRPPYGASNNEVVNLAESFNMPIVMWSVDSLDWKTRNATAIHNEIMSSTTNGAIILMHDIHQATAEALPTVLHGLSKQGYSFVTVSELLEWRGDTGVGPHFGTYKTE